MSTENDIQFKVCKLGVSGGTGGKLEHISIPSGAILTGIQVRSGLYVDKVTLFYKTSDSKENSISIGSDGGTLNEKIDLTNQRIIRICGKYGNVVDRIEIITDKRSYGPYGESNGSSEYTYDIPDDYLISGLYARHGKVVDAFGIIISKT